MPSLAHITSGFFSQFDFTEGERRCAHRFQIVPSGQTADSAIFDQTLGGEPGQAYLLADFGLLNDIGGDIYEIDLSEIEPGSARGRLIGLSPDAGAVDIRTDRWR